MHFSTLVTLSCLFSLGLTQTITGQYSCLPAGEFTLCQNLWGELAGVGSQQSTLVGTTSNTVSWSTNWTWANGPDNVKSYANVQSLTASGVQLQNIASAPTSWDWTYETQSTGIRADVSYDIWFGTASSGEPASTASSYEIMIWLSGLGGIQPVGSQITTATPIGNWTWNLWKGPNTNWEVFSFVSATGNLPSWNADLNDFFTYLVQEQGVAPTQYVQAIQSGTEAFEGAANLVTTSFSVSIIPGTPGQQS
ncbi:endocellulase [Mycena maculata]|uniref:Endocellulase n=1 Tax=Mycena maculata TaxID=230809 RepID=A0AAD7JUS5_9AGAR|nr:endocellulase [Mycena maculata]